jgi:putative hydrolase of the HAD superfamily
MGPPGSREQDSASATASVPVRAAIVDCLGTLIELEPPAARLRAKLRLAGIDVEEDRAADAFRAEIDYYLGHHLEGSDESGLASLREDCARVLRESLGLGPETQGAVREAMLTALRFRPYPDTVPSLRALRRARVPVVVASNWDCSLARTLERVGLRRLIESVATSAEVGAAKPDPAVLRAALAAVGARPEEAMAVGDSLEHDVAAARRAGITPVLLRREAAWARASPPSGVAQVGTLAEAVPVILKSR